MNNKLLAITILEQHSKLLLDQTDTTYEELQTAIKQLRDVEHYTHHTTGLWATDRPDLFNQHEHFNVMYQLNFWAPSQEE